MPHAIGRGHRPLGTNLKGIGSNLLKTNFPNSTFSNDKIHFPTIKDKERTRSFVFQLAFTKIYSFFRQ